MDIARGFVLAILLALWASCAPTREVSAASDPELEREIDQIKAVDNHAHPVRVPSPGEPPDRDFDALPADSMEPMSDPVNRRPGSPQAADAARDLYGSADRQVKLRVIKERGGGYPAWVLDKLGIETMLANRVAMGSSIQSPRFHWVPYADALLF